MPAQTASIGTSSATRAPRNGTDGTGARGRSARWPGSTAGRTARARDTSARYLSASAWRASFSPARPAGVLSSSIVSSPSNASVQ